MDDDHVKDGWDASHEIQNVRIPSILFDNSVMNNVNEFNNKWVNSTRENLNCFSQMCVKILEMLFIFKRNDSNKA